MLDFLEATWADHRIYDTDIEYIRKDVFDATVDGIRKEAMESVRPLIMYLANRYDPETVKKSGAELNAFQLWGGVDLDAFRLAIDLGWIKDEEE